MPLRCQHLLWFNELSFAFLSPPLLLLLHTLPLILSCGRWCGCSLGAFGVALLSCRVNRYPDQTIEGGAVDTARADASRNVRMQRRQYNVAGGR